MFQNNKTSPKRKASWRNGLKSNASRGRTGLGLAVDTSFSRHRGQTPQQLFPAKETASKGFEYESRTPETAHETLGLAQPVPRSMGLRYLLENQGSARPIPVRSASDNPGARAPVVGLPARPDAHRTATADTHALSVPALHKRVKGLRPSPLDLTDVSPSDRAITIGIAIPSAALSNQTISPGSGGSNLTSPNYHCQEATTPTIIVTPAREDFGISLSPNDHRLHGTNRPASSVYSRSTNYVPKTANFERTPPVPPLPLFAQKMRTKTVPESTANIYDRSASAESHKATLSVCTFFEEEEDDDTALQTCSEKSPPRQLFRRMTSQSMLPTPRRSRGWWNVLTSPFSARSNGFFWRSPVQDSHDRVAILNDVANMGEADVSRNPSFADRTLDDEEIRSAPPHGSPVRASTIGKPVPQRSATAPGAIDPNAPDFNIYRVPSQGAAAAYYDQNRHFPSLLIDPRDGTSRSAFEELSPLTDVCACEYHNHGNPICSNSPVPDIDDVKELDAEAQRSSAVTNTTIIENDRDTILSPFADAHAIDSPASSHAQQRSIFTSPTADELKTATPVRPNPGRSETQATVESHFSALTDNTPTVEDAHIATFVGPDSSHGEQRAVVVTPSRSATPPSAPSAGLQAATMASRSIDEPSAGPESTAPFPRPSHNRNESYGLGISGSETTSEKDLYPPPKPLSQKPRLGTDRFGQLKLIIPGDEKPKRPWHKRFLWLIISIIAFLLLLLVVLLMVLVPQKYNDVAVQGQWLNLTGYPPLPTGVTTVVQPDMAKQDGCVKPAGLWSCAAPQNKKSGGSLNTAGQPDFRLEIRFKNGTSSNSSALEPVLHRRSGPASVKAKLLHARGAWSSILFSPSPRPPGKDDQLFLGKTTDNITAPYNGEETPFYLTLLDPSALSGLQKRDGSKYPYPYPSASSSSSNTTDSSTSSSNATTSAAKSIPKPALQANGHPESASLYPLAQAQALRLYNRGQEDEHYGFYTYFDRSLYVSNMTNASVTANTAATAGVALEDATAVCTWSQTRWHVQIWTRKATSSLLSNTADGGNQTADVRLMGSGSSEALSAANSTANDLSRPGSFPYAVTISLDRHGGDAKKKGVYCHGLNAEHQVTDASMWVPEDRSFGGDLVNPADVPGEDGANGKRKRDDNEGSGIDGGTGGCGCEWTNWT